MITLQEKDRMRLFNYEENKDFRYVLWTLCNAITQALESINEIEDVKVNLKKREATFEEEKSVGMSLIKRVIPTSKFKGGARFIVYPFFLISY